MSISCIALALEDTGVIAPTLAPFEREWVMANLLKRLGVDVVNKSPWDNVNAPGGKLRHDGWELISSYVGANHCFLFTLGAITIWKFDNGSDLNRVLQDCPPIEFYVCDSGFDYLLCFNHHDHVVGWGSAAPWVDGLNV